MKPQICFDREIGFQASHMQHDHVLLESDLDVMFPKAVISFIRLKSESDECNILRKIRSRFPNNISDWSNQTKVEDTRCMNVFKSSMRISSLQL